MLEYPWPHDGYDLEYLIQAANLYSGKQQEEMGSTSHVHFFNYEKFYQDRFSKVGLV